jgi:glycosyltransferase involved in cell wall biosynthesis
MTQSLTYVVVTPARNEAKFIGMTLESMVAQTVPAAKWVIVSDGSTDGTDEIVKQYAARYPWIELVRMPEGRERSFAGKVHAFNAGFAAVAQLEWDIVASLDADISFDKDYFAFLLGKLSTDSKLGLVGTPFREPSGESYDYRFVNIEHVSGACQVFRRECFQEIGGYLPIKGGSIDHVALITARMRGWKTRTFPEKYCLHHRVMGTGQWGSVVSANFKLGRKDYALGSHPLWQLFRTTYQMTKSPFVVRGAALGAGYLWSMILGAKRPVSEQLIRFHRQEQIQRLKKFFAGRTASNSTPHPTAPARKPQEETAITEQQHSRS